MNKYIHTSYKTVHHGTFHDQPFICLGFRVDDFSYISDAVKIPEPSFEIIKGSSVVILDALRCNYYNFFFFFFFFIFIKNFNFFLIYIFFFNFFFFYFFFFFFF